VTDFIFDYKARIAFLGGYINVTHKLADTLGIHHRDVLPLMEVSRSELLGEPHSITSLARAVNSSAASMSRFVDRMIQKDIIVKVNVEGRGRETELRISERSRRMEAFPAKLIYEEFVQIILDRVSK